ncbi:MAG: cysteine desulfurase [Planctomycetaceae bacterium]|nr:cysteine desulfurase [Planctomycetaceae bacterium]
MIEKNLERLSTETSILPPTRPVYLDHHATTPVDPRVFAAMKPWLTERFGNAASISHRYGDEARDAVEQARRQIAALVNCEPTEVIFTSGATEANNLALKGFLWQVGKECELIVNRGEHKAVLDPAERLSRDGYSVNTIEINRVGQVETDSLAEALSAHTGLVSVMFANNEVGTINPIAEIAELCSERKIRLHCDAVQAVGILDVDLQQVPIDLLSLSAHKFYGPQGVGALIVRRDRGRIPLTPLLDGGGHERHLRSGTLPVALIVGFGEACRLAQAEKSADSQRLSKLRDRLWNRLASQLSGLHRNGPPDNCLPQNLNVSVEGVDGDALMTGLTKIAVSSGSACTSADPAPSHVLRAMGLSESLTKASLRFGLGRSTTEEEIDLAIEHVTEVVQHLRS